MSGISFIKQFVNYCAVNNQYRWFWNLALLDTRIEKTGVFKRVYIEDSPYTNLGNVKGASFLKKIKDEYKFAG